MARRTKGEGSLCQVSDKSWVFQYKVDGQRKTKRFRRKADAKAFMDTLSAASTVEESQPLPLPLELRQSTEVTTLGEWMDRWLEGYARPTVKLSTYCSYELYIRVHIKPQIGALYLNTLRVDDLQNFFNERGKRGNLRTEGGLRWENVDIDVLCFSPKSHIKN